MSKDNDTPVLTSTDAKGQEHAMAGYRPMKAAPDAQVYQPSEEIKSGKLPKKVDLRPYLTPVEDQGQTSSCVANAVAGAYEYWTKRRGETDFNVSRLFVYYNARWRNGEQDEDAGSVIQLAMEGLGDFGACSERTWPFERKLLLVKPNRQAYQEGAAYRVYDREHVPVDLNAWKQCLAQGLPIVFGCVLFDSFDECNSRGGVVPMPDPNDVTRAEHGGHSMCCVGYSDVEEVFIVRNSWGEDWGDKGYCYMPYNYLMNPKFNDGDCWVFSPDEKMPTPKDAWLNDDKPVVNGGLGVDFLINAFSIAAYSGLATDFFKSLGTLDYNDMVESEYADHTEAVNNEDWDSMDDFEPEDVAEDEDPDSQDDDSDNQDDSEDQDDTEDPDDSDDQDDSQDQDDDGNDDSGGDDSGGGDDQ